MSPPDFKKHYRTQFHTGGWHEGLKLGSHTDVRIIDLKSEVVPQSTDRIADKRTKIIALVELSCEVGVVTSGEYSICSICMKSPPEPDHDALWFILENHDGQRLVFPCEEEAKDERDTYPVQGWIKVSDGGEGKLVCAECSTELREAADKIRERRRKK